MGTDVDKLFEEQAIDETEPSSNTLRKGLAFIERKKFPMPKHWTAEQLDMLEFPSDLTLLSFDDLGKQMGIWTSVIAYTQFQVAMADVEHTAKNNKLEYERKKMYLTLLQANKGTETQRTAVIKTDPTIVKLQSDYEVARARYVMVKALLDSYSKYYTAFSRELSRRGVVGADRPPRSDCEDMDLKEDMDRGRALFTRKGV